MWETLIQAVELCRQLYGGDTAKVALKLGISATTLNSFRHRPEKFTLQELIALYRILRVDFKLPQVTIGG